MGLPGPRGGWGAAGAKATAHMSCRGRTTAGGPPLPRLLSGHLHNKVPELKSWPRLPLSAPCEVVRDGHTGPIPPNSESFTQHSVSKSRHFCSAPCEMKITGRETSSQLHLIKTPPAAVPKKWSFPTLPAPGHGSPLCTPHTALTLGSGAWFVWSRLLVSPPVPVNHGHVG